MADLMQATTANSTSIHFGIGHMCHTHNKVYTVDHIAECNQLEGCESIPKYAQMLKEKPFQQWSLDDKKESICAFATLMIKLHHLTLHKLASLT